MIYNINDYIDQHNDICYCEAIIYPDGTIEDCIPSHQLKLIEITNKKNNINNPYDKNLLLNIIPLEADVNNWLICYNNVVALWYNFCFYNIMNDKQKYSIQKLINNNILSNNYRCIYTDEKRRIELINEYKNGTINENEFSRIIGEMRKEDIYLKSNL